MQIKIVLYFLCFVLCLAACRVKLYEPTEINAQKGGVSVADLRAGKELYETKCQKCHGLKNPGRYDGLKWLKILNWMQPKAKITDQQKMLILGYLTSEVKK